MKKLRPAFTIIEILISVIILSFAIIFVLKIHTDNHEHIIYLSERNKHSLQDSLYLSKNIFRYHKDNRTAYDILAREFKIKEIESRKILKSTNRHIFIPETEIIEPEKSEDKEKRRPTVILNEILIKDKHSARYYHFKIQGL